MRLYTIESENKQYVAVEGKDGRPVALDSLGINVKDMNELIRRYDELSLTITDRLEKDTPKEIGREYRIKAPIPIPVQDIICLGVNYRSHIEETVDVLDFTKKTDTVYFSKRVNMANDPEGIIPSYDFVDSLDYEVELGVILKKDALNVPIAAAADYILGYTIINDVSARNLQLKHQQWYRGKSLDGYTDDDITLLMNHINSTKRMSLGGKSPYEMVAEGDESMKWLMQIMGMDAIPADDVHLKPDLLIR